jgi:hypothetical protein
MAHGQRRSGNSRMRFVRADRSVACISQAKFIPCFHLLPSPIQYIRDFLISGQLFVEASNFATSSRTLRRFDQKPGNGVEYPFI